MSQTLGLLGSGSYAYLYQGAFSDLSGKYLALVDGKTPIFEGASLS